MDLRTKRKIEMNDQKEKRKQEVIEAAVKVLKEKGIEKSKMADIAEKAEVGVASVYRYFKTKPELVIATGTEFWREEIDSLYHNLNSLDFDELNGLEKVNRILNVFLILFQEQSDFIRFIEEFDNYIVKEQIHPDKLQTYEKGIIDLKPVMFEALKQGKKDGSVRKDIDDNKFYVTITHSLMTLCQKLTIRGTILKSDKEIGSEVQIRLLIEMALAYIKND
jgi:AcrR family transcriptional regulator